LFGEGVLFRVRFGEYTARPIDCVRYLLETRLPLPTRAHDTGIGKTLEDG